VADPRLKSGTAVPQSKSPARTFWSHAAARGLARRCRSLAFPERFCAIPIMNLRSFMTPFSQEPAANFNGTGHLTELPDMTLGREGPKDWLE